MNLWLIFRTCVKYITNTSEAYYTKNTESFINPINKDTLYGYGLLDYNKVIEIDNFMKWIMKKEEDLADFNELLTVLMMTKRTIV